MKKRKLLLIASVLIITGTKICFAQTPNVGIGTSSPGSRLTVNGSFAGRYNTISATSYSMSSDDYYLAWNGLSDGTITLPPALAFGSGNFKGRIYCLKNLTTNRTVSLVASGSELIDNQSTVGISSIPITPGQFIMLVSTGNTSTNTWEIAFIGVNTVGSIIGADNGLTLGYNTPQKIGFGGALLKPTDIALSGHNLTYSGLGNMGLGTSQPISRLSVVNDGQPGAYADDIELTSFNSNPAPVFFFKTATGTQSSPQNLTTGLNMGSLAWEGRIGGMNSIQSMISAYYTGNGSTSLSNLNFFTSGTSRIIIADNGNVAVGTNYAPTDAKFSVSNGTTQGAYTLAGWIHSSDARLKTNILPLRNALDIIQKLNGVYYTWKKQPKAGRQIGFLAQEVRKVLPEVVIGIEGDISKGETLGMAYQNMIPVLVEAIKDQQTQIEALRKEITGLKSLSKSKIRQ